MVSRLTSAAVAAVIALLLASPAWAGVALKLPAGEDPQAWAPYFALVGFEAQPTLPADGPWVELVAVANRWEVRVRTADGKLSGRSVAVPDSARDREQIVSVANSLLNPPKWTEPSWTDLGVDVPAPTEAPAIVVVPEVVAVAVTVPTPRPPPPPTAPPTTPPAVEPEPTPLVREPVASVDPAPADAPQPVAVVAPAPEPVPPAEPLPLTLSTNGAIGVAPVRTRAGPWIRGGGGVGWRPGGPPGGLIEVAGGVWFMDHWRAGIGLEITTPATLDALGGERRFGSVDPSIILATRIPKVGAMFSVRGGPGWRLFESQGALFQAVLVPWFGAEVGWDIRLPGPRGPSSPTMIELALGARFDARRIDLAVQSSGIDPIAMPQFSGTAAIRVLYQPEGRRVAWTAAWPADPGALAFGQDSTRSEVIDPDRTDH